MLLNVDYKILAKLLAMRLELVLPLIISPDQIGFIKNRLSFFNIRQLFNIIYNPPFTDISEVIISLDAKKPFDCIECLFYTLNKFGFGSKFITWIKPSLN